MTLLGRLTAMWYIDQTCEIENIFKKCDRFTEGLEEQFMEEEKEVYSVAEKMVGW